MSAQAVTWIRVAGAALVISLVGNLAFVLHLHSERSQPRYPLVYAGFGHLDATALEQVRRGYRVNYGGLRQRILAEIEPQAGPTYGYYFENLNSGAWVGIREREPYSPGSLRKVPMMAAAAKRVRARELRWDMRLTLQPDDIDHHYDAVEGRGPLAHRAPGYDLSLEEIMRYVARYSDNTATSVLFRAVGHEAYADAMFNLGLSWSTYARNEATGHMDDYPLSPREYASVFRGLYYSSHLHPADSQLVLALLTDTVFVEGLRAGVPAEVVVAHKNGDWLQPRQHPDCGIVYHPDTPYLLCVMTRDQLPAAAADLTQRLSRLTYDFVDRDN